MRKQGLHPKHQKLMHSVAQGFKMSTNLSGRASPTVLNKIKVWVTCWSLLKPCHCLPCHMLWCIILHGSWIRTTIFSVLVPEVDILATPPLSLQYQHLAASFFHCYQKSSQTPPAKFELLWLIFNPPFKTSLEDRKQNAFPLSHAMGSQKPHNGRKWGRGSGITPDFNKWDARVLTNGSHCGFWWFFGAGLNLSWPHMPLGAEGSFQSRFDSFRRP